MLPRAANGRDYRITVGLPDSYAAHPERRYPVLYVTDGYWDYKLCKSIVGGLVYDKAIPEVILVGIGYPGEAPDYGRLRRWDLTPVSRRPTTRTWARAGTRASSSTCSSARSSLTSRGATAWTPGTACWAARRWAAVRAVRDVDPAGAVRRVHRAQPGDAVRARLAVRLRGRVRQVRQAAGGASLHHRRREGRAVDGRRRSRSSTRSCARTPTRGWSTSSASSRASAIRAPSPRASTAGSASPSRRARPRTVGDGQGNPARRPRVSRRRSRSACGPSRMGSRRSGRLQPEAVAVEIERTSPLQRAAVPSASGGWPARTSPGPR